MEKVINLSRSEDGRLNVQQEYRDATVVETPTEAPIIQQEAQVEEHIPPVAEAKEVEVKVEQVPTTPQEVAPTFNFEEEFSKKTNGKFKSVEEVLNLTEQFESKLKELESKPKFANEYVEKLNDYLANGGDVDTFVKFQKLEIDQMDDLSVALEYYRTVEGITDQEELESFIFDKYKQGVDPEEFGLADWQVKSGKVHLAQDAKQFRQKIAELKAKSLTVEPKQTGLSQEEMAIIEAKNNLFKEIQESANLYKGFTVSTDDPEAKVSIDIALDDNAKAKISRIVENPENNIWELFATKDNQFDKAKFIKATHILQDPEKWEKTIASNAYMQGVNSILQQTKNATVPSNTIQSPTVGVEDTLEADREAIRRQLFNRF